MGRVGRGGREHDLGIARQLDRPLVIRAVDQRDAPQFDVVLRGNADLRVRIYSPVTVTKLGAPLREDGFVTLRGSERRLVGGRPKFAGGNIAEVHKRSPAVARGVFAPAG